MGMLDGVSWARLGSRETMKKTELKAYRQKLLELRARLTGDVAQLSDEAFRKNAGDAAERKDSEEVGVDTTDQDITIQMLQTEGNVLQEIEAAIKRIDEGTFGICEMSGKPIPKARLNVLPWTRYRVECAKIAEMGG